MRCSSMPSYDPSREVGDPLASWMHRVGGEPTEVPLPPPGRSVRHLDRSETWSVP